MKEQTAENPVEQPGLTDDRGFDSEQIEGRRAQNKAKGLRELPYPFGSAVAIVSDVDASTRARYDKYVGALVDQYGLDFGDSTWLRWNSVQRDRTGAVIGTGLGFLSPSLGFGTREESGVYANTRTFAESIIEYHRGNVDHFHAFLSWGPRVVVIDQLNRSGGRVVASPREFQVQGPWSCKGLNLFGVCVVGRVGESIRVRSVEIREHDGQVTTDFQPRSITMPANGREHRFFGFTAAVETERQAPFITDIATIVVELEEPGDAQNVERLLLASAYGELLLDRLALLRNRFNVEAALVTEHAGLHFRGRHRARESDRRLSNYAEITAEPLGALNGRLHDPEGRLVFSTDADDPLSICRVLPELSGDLELRFVVPVAAGSALGWDPFQLVSPTSTSSGGGLYWARRTMPKFAEPEDGRKFDPFKSKQETFAARITRVLEETSERPGLLWPVYTHLGGVNDTVRELRRVALEEGRRGREHDFLPSPYFDPELLCALQERVFNISGSTPIAARIWAPRATVLYDYALVLTRIAEHVERPDADTVEITSWSDETLGKMLPRSPGQLYGLTFYVDDPARAVVRLDGKPLTTLIRNGPDETGRTSVTIGEAEIRTVVFDRLDPTANLDQPAELSGGGWAWSGGNGRLSVDAAGPGTARLDLPQHGLAAPGAQLLTMTLRLDPGAAFGMLLETETGGQFFFGDETVRAQLGEVVDAAYIFDMDTRGGGREPSAWRELVAPFADMTWREGASPGGPMPSHPVLQITLLCRGPAGAGADLRGLAFLRPRATAISQRPDAAFCVGGRVPEFRPGQNVHLAPAGGPDEPERLQALDQRGCFCFDGVPAGLYRLWSSDLCDRRGMIVEVGANLVGLVLDRRVIQEKAADRPRDDLHSRAVKA